MIERQPLTQYIPETQRAEVEARDELAPVVSRIAQVLPPEKIWDLFASSPTATGGRVVFPYCRVDMAVVSCNTYSYLINKHRSDPAKLAEWFEGATQSALRAVAWVEVGFEGLESLARSRASVNWTSGVGHIVTDEERAERIMGEGARIYRNFLSGFADLRTENGIVDDDFTRFGLEDTLYGIKTAKARAGLAEVGVSAKRIEDTIDVLSKVNTYEGLGNEFAQRKWNCDEEQFLMPVIQPVYLADAKLRERVIQRISEQAGVSREVAHEYMSEMVHNPSLVYTLRYGDEVGREAVERFINSAPRIVFDETRNYLGLQRPRSNG